MGEEHERGRTGAHGPLRYLRRAAAATPAHRDRYIDFLRAVAISLVVLGHWLAAVIVADDGGVRGDNALAHLDWAQSLTWFFQVMPVFFLVGGYANAASMDAHRRRGGDGPGWFLGRTDRLLRPTTAFLAVLWTTALAARLLGVPPEPLGLGVWAASIPLWFLAAYLGVVLCAPAMDHLHRRHGLTVPAVLVLAVLALDGLRLGAGLPLVGQANHLLVWLALHQLGFVWRDRWTEARPGVPAALAAGGVGALVLLTAVGPYPASMVDVPGADLGNTSPPTFALLVLGLTQAALVVAVAAPVRRALRRRGPWTAVIAVNAVVLTLFLWHMTAAVLTGALVYGTGLFPQPPVDSAAWVLMRIPWLLAVLPVLLVLVAVFGGVEARTTASSAGWRAGALRGVPAGRAVANLLVLAASPMVIGGLVWIALAGPGHHGIGTLPTAACLVYAVGASTLRLARRARARDGPGGTGREE
ncbi:acyltransferase family protein [Nocardiopsis aegyptia]|uniref:Acyltransferase 3 domain-containing protein n=1 Tax=Nocardiopsis aegyptia TaxID=220378 RepID=A0A7Z0ESI9_9ACTN|nr:acyltransferase [Nocardiopsis aegyptia]NYJ36550.1 hypothetical protein [Nocardiopsis aegyptia]